ncbi:hypothetical protein Pmani_037965 [Petrolisthes manimaculis]|uniref:Uncharacterized protein n=1 Tax=Petrolisthes manimaculis TaxID=1843537 RepID=A0AAE1NGS9_9EUCA|nr:hypothetical protein Pmani_037965 [Petrolisthes manimaculis]
MSQSPSWQMPATCVALVWNALSQVWTRVPPGVWDELCPLFGGVMSGMRRWGVSQQEGQPAEYPSSLQASATLRCLMIYDEWHYTLMTQKEVVATHYYRQTWLLVPSTRHCFSLLNPGQG